jgi:hypothetical protein
MAEIAADLFTGPDHETLCWEFDEKAGSNWETHKRTSPRLKLAVAHFQRLNHR